MMSALEMKATLQIIHNDGVIEHVDIEFSEEELCLLRAYCDDAWRLRTSALFGEKAANKFTLNWKMGEKPTFTGDPIDDEAWAAGMHRLRPLLLDNEPTSFLQTASLLGKRIQNSAVLERLKILRRRFRGELAPMQISLGIDGKVRSMDEIFDMWINAFEHHRDRDKQEFFERTSKFAPEHQMRHYINMHAAEKLRAIRGLMKLIVETCGESMKPAGLVALEKKAADV